MTAIFPITPSTASASLPVSNKNYTGPNLALAAILVGLKVEQSAHAKMQKSIQLIQNDQQNWKLLLNLQTELPQLKEGGAISPQLQSLLNTLKANGIELHKIGKRTLTKEMVEDMKLQSTSHIDQLRFKTQHLFSTKIQVIMQLITPMLEALKMISQSQDRLIRKTQTLPGH